LSTKRGDSPIPAIDIPDPVDETIDESFPASDPPEWTGTHAGEPAGRKEPAAVATGANAAPGASREPGVGEARMAFEHDPSSTYVCLSPSGAASAIELTPEFWSTVDDRSDLDEGRLVAAFDSDGDWEIWEMHPHGEEVLVLLTGSMTMVFEERGGERSVELHPGRACIVPRGVWHRAVVPVPSRLLAITYGRATEHRPR
jgi:mannose-6-phosphate isomerase-like protein (cupin superfamily)